MRSAQWVLLVAFTTALLRGIEAHRPHPLHVLLDDDEDFDSEVRIDFSELGSGGGDGAGERPKLSLLEAGEIFNEKVAGGFARSKREQRHNRRQRATPKASQRQGERPRGDHAGPCEGAGCLKQEDGAFAVSASGCGMHGGAGSRGSATHGAGCDHVEAAAALLQSSRLNTTTVEGGASAKESVLKDSRFQPFAETYLCMQVDIGLAPGVGGATLNLGITGGVTYKMATGCWSLSLQMMLGFSVGLPLLGRLGLTSQFAFRISGILNVDEVPVAEALKDPSAYDALRVQTFRYAPAGSQPHRCYTSNPWVIVQTWVEQWIRRVRRGGLFRGSLAQKVAEARKTCEEDPKCKAQLDSYDLILADIGINTSAISVGDDLRPQQDQSAKQCLTLDSESSDSDFTVDDDNIVLEGHPHWAGLGESAADCIDGADLKAPNADRASKLAGDSVIETGAVADIDRGHDDGGIAAGGADISRQPPPPSSPSFLPLVARPDGKFLREVAALHGKMRLFLLFTVRYAKQAFQVLHYVPPGKGKLTRSIAFLVSQLLRTEVYRISTGRFVSYWPDKDFRALEATDGHHVNDVSFSLQYCSDEAANGDYRFARFQNGFPMYEKFKLSKLGLPLATAVYVRKDGSREEDKAWVMVKRRTVLYSVPNPEGQSGLSLALSVGQWRRSETQRPSRCELDAEPRLTQRELRYSRVRRFPTGAVLNLPAVICKSVHRIDPKFWREIAISASNIFVRMVADVQAIFSAFFAGHPGWSGICAELPLELRGSGAMTYLMMRTRGGRKWVGLESTRFHSWASRQDVYLKAFLQEQLGEKRAIEKLPLHPHLWCHMASGSDRRASQARHRRHPADGHNHGETVKTDSSDAEELEHEPNTIEVRVDQACTLVETIDRPFQALDELEWNDITKTCEVIQFLVDPSEPPPVAEPPPMTRRIDGTPTLQGILFDAATEQPVPKELCHRLHGRQGGAENAEPPTETRLVRRMVTESRSGECQEVTLSMPFVGMFPSFALEVLRMRDIIGDYLGQINACLGQELQRADGPSGGGGASVQCSGKERLPRVRRLAVDIVYVLRGLALRLGAASGVELEAEVGKLRGIDPAGSGCTAVPDQLPDEERDLWKGGAVPELIAEVLLGDFRRRFGVQDEQGRFLNFGSSDQRSLNVGSERIDVVQDHKEDSSPSSAATASTSIDRLMSLRVVGDWWPVLFDKKVQKDILYGSRVVARYGSWDYKLRPPLSYTWAFTVNSKLAAAGNDLCIRERPVLSLQALFTRTERTYSSALSSSQLCQVGRLQLGHLAGEVVRCKVGDKSTMKVTFELEVIYGDVMAQNQGLISSTLNGITGLGSFAASATASASMLAVNVGALGPWRQVTRSDSWNTVWAGLCVTSPLSSVLFGAISGLEGMRGMLIEIRDVMVGIGLVSPQVLQSVWSTTPIFRLIINELLIWSTTFSSEKLRAYEAFDPTLARLQGVSVAKGSRTFAVKMASVSIGEVFLPISTSGTLELAVRLHIGLDFTNWYKEQFNAKMAEWTKTQRSNCLKCIEVDGYYCDRRPLLGMYYAETWRPGWRRCIIQHRLAHQKCRGVYVDDNNILVGPILARSRDICEHLPETRLLNGRFDTKSKDWLALSAALQRELGHHGRRPILGHLREPLPDAEMAQEQEGLISMSSAWNFDDGDESDNGLKLNSWEEDE